LLQYAGFIKGFDMKTIRYNMYCLEIKMRKIEDACGWTKWCNRMLRNSYTHDPIEPLLPAAHARALAKWHRLYAKFMASPI